MMTLSHQLLSLFQPLPQILMALLFASSHSGTNVVTVSYTEGGVTVTATYNIVVTEAQVLSAINNLSGIHFGATYALGSPDNDVAMKAEHSNFLVHILLLM